MRLSRAGVERREAPGPTRPKAATPGNRGPAVARGGADRKAPQDASPASKALPGAPFPFGETKKGTTARAAPQTIRAAERWLSVLAAPIRPQRISLKRRARKSPEKIDDARHQMDS